MSRSGRINDLHSLVNEARSQGSGTAHGGNGSESHSHSRSFADDASLSSFSKSMARVASESSVRSGHNPNSHGNHNNGGGTSARSIASQSGRSFGSVSRRSNNVPPPPPPGGYSANPRPYANMMSSNDSVISGASDVSGAGGGGAGGVPSGAQSVSERTNTTAKLMSLVQELSSRASASESGGGGSAMSAGTGLSGNGQRGASVAGSGMGSASSGPGNNGSTARSSVPTQSSRDPPPSHGPRSVGPMSHKGSLGSHGSRSSGSRGSSSGESRGRNPSQSQSQSQSLGRRSFSNQDESYGYQNGMHPEVFINQFDGMDERSVDAESLSLASGLETHVSSRRAVPVGLPGNGSFQGSSLQGSHGPRSHGGMSYRPPPPPHPHHRGMANSSNASHGSANGGYPVPYLHNPSNNNGGVPPRGDPSVAGSRSAYSQNSSYASGSQYSQSTGMSSSHASGSEDPGGYIMPRGLGVTTNGSVYSQSTYNGSNNIHGNGSAMSSAHSSAMHSNPSMVGGSLMNNSHPSSVMSQSETNSQYSESQSQSRYSVASGTLESQSAYSRRSSGSGSGNGSHGTHRSSIPGSSASAPGGSHGSRNSGPMMRGMMDEQSIASRSYLSQPLPGSNGPDEFHAHPPMPYDDPYEPPPMPNFQQVVPHYGPAPASGLYDDYSSFASKNTRSIAGSAALIPRAKFSWASESLGTQSTVATRRSINSTSVPESNEQRESKAVEGRLWSSFAWIITFPLPNKCIMRPTKDAKQAWREKVALFLIMVSCSVFFVGVFGFVPLLLCKEDIVFSMQDIWLQTGENWVVVHGTIYDVKDLVYRHPGGVDGIVDFLGKDASKVFPRAPPVTLPEKCLDMEKVEAYQLNVYAPDNNFTNPTCQSFTELDVLLGITCHTFAAGSNGTAKFLGDYERGLLSHTTVGLNSEGIRWIGIYDRVYDVTTYVNGIQQNSEPTQDGEDSNLLNNPGAYLTPTLNKVIMNSLNADATDLYEALFGSTEYIACLEELFYIGLLDDELDTFCHILNIMMYTMLISVATLMVIQFLASMIYICPRHRTYSEEDVMSPVMVMVPCYNEGDNELRKTIKSVLNTTYPDENKVLFMVADGIVTGNGEDMSTPEHLANILGFDIDEFEDDTFEYDCIGVTHTKNRARVYHGILQKGHKFLKYICVVKCGLPAETTSSAKPGNRGKRDSQLITMGYYNRIHYGRELTELDSAVQRAMVDLNLQADMVRFLMAIDADTRVDTMSVTHMVYGMDKKERVLALCGETKVDNKASSWVTMIQVFEYYNAHHLKKAFEAAFGCVTCLPGCFTMYRIIADDGTPLLPADGVLYDYSRNDVETLHEKNLYHLGEDRMLTTLLLKHFPDRSLTFIPEATCWTIVPHTFKILLSQRRRWINSTVHNMFELLRVNTMCGVCCVSMKVVVFIDLIATMILPASYCYAMYLIFLVFFEDLPVSTVLLILYAIIMGVQVVVFILRSRWDYCWWFFVYFTVGLPVFYVILPVYSFWNMDDFSWGKTRSVGGSAAANAGGDEGGSVAGAKNLEEDENASVNKDDDRSTTSSSSSASEERSEAGSEDGSEECSEEGSEEESEGSNEEGTRYSDDEDEGTEYTGQSDDKSGSRYSGSRYSSRSRQTARTR